MGNARAPRLTAVSAIAPPPQNALSAVRLSHITKSFSGVEVLKGVDFDLRQGEVHALLGGNGAGKSTLMKILEGVYTADSGSAEIAGKPVDLSSALDAAAYGVAMIFQEFSLIPTLSVAQNIFLAREPKTSGGLLDDRAAERESAKIFAKMGVDIDPKAQLRTLSTGSWQLTEIAKALSKEARVLIMDEPTASLTSSETRAFFEIIRTLKGQGIAIVYISHRMEEIFEIADRVTVLRDGSNVGTQRVADVTMAGLIEEIIGKKVETAFAWQERHVDRSVAPLLEVNDLQGGRLRGVSLRLYPGEIVGLAGLMGSGRTELARALFGIDRLSGGTLKVRGQTQSISSPHAAIEAGICLIPEDRREQGLVLEHSVQSNLMLTLLKRLSTRGWVDDVEGRALSEKLVARLSIRTASVAQKTRLLSGGNQQKIVIAKWLAAEPDVLIMDEPTAGVDIGAKGEIVALIRELADAGKGIIVISSELPELLALSDRVLVMREGTVEREFARQDIRDESQLQQILHRG